MPFITIDYSPLAKRKDVRLHYREAGKGVPLLFMHGGWGYEIYPFDKQIAAFEDEFRMIIPDRSGYGRSPRIDSMDWNFHRLAAQEMIACLDALGVDRAFLWGHSDGSVIAIWMALAQPKRFHGLILEAFHYYRVKPGSRGFFETMMRDPKLLGERVVDTLAQEHGEDYWFKLIEMNGIAWLKLADQAESPEQDLYDGRLAQLQTKAIFIHGKLDPRTEPDELTVVQRQLPQTPIRLLEEGKHSPHSERAAAGESIQLATKFFQEALE